MADPVGPDKKPVATGRFNEEDWADLQFRTTAGFASTRIEKVFPDNQPFSEEGQSQTLTSFSGTVGVHYLVPISRVTSSLWQVSIGGDVVGQAGSLDRAGATAAPALIYTWDNDRYEWRFEPNYTLTQVLGSQEFFFPQDPQGRSFKIRTGLLHEIGGAMSFGIHLNQHVTLGILGSGSTFTNLQVENRADESDVLDLPPTFNYSIRPVLTIRPFGSNKSWRHKKISPEEAYNQIRVLKDQWERREILYEKKGEDFRVRFKYPDNSRWIDLEEEGEKAAKGNSPVSELSRVLDKIYLLMRQGGLDQGAVRLQIIGQAEESGEPYEDARMAGDVAEALQHHVEARIAGQPYHQNKPILVASTHYGDERRNEDVLLVKILLASETVQEGPDLEALKQESVRRHTAEIVARVQSIVAEFENARLSFPDEKTTNFEDGPGSAFQELYKKIIPPTLEIMDLIREIPDPELKEYLREHMRIQLTGHAYNVALADPPGGETEEDYNKKTNRLPQYFLDVGLQRAQGVKTALLNGIDKDVDGIIKGYSKGSVRREKVNRDWLHRIFSIEPAAPFTPDHMVTIRQKRQLGTTGGFAGMMGGYGGFTKEERMQRLKDINDNPYVEREISLHFDGDYFEKTHLQETDNTNHVKFHAFVPVDREPLKTYKTPFLANKALCQNKPCDPVEESQTQRAGRTGQAAGTPRPTSRPPAKPPRGSSGGRGDGR